MSAYTRQAMALLFDRTAKTYDALGVDFFGAFAKELLDRVGLVPGQRVLDVGCGRGAVLFPAAERVGSGGSVLGIDLSSAMVERTTKDIEDRRLANASVSLMDAQEPTLTDADFDVVLASFVVFFLPDPVAGLRSWHRLLKAGGRMGVTTFGGDDPRWAGVREVFKPFVSPELAWTLAVRAGLFATVEGFDQVVESAGFTGVTSVERVYPVKFADPSRWITWSWSHGQRMFWELVPEDRLDTVRRAVLAELEPLREPDGSVVLAQTVRYTIAHRG
ncbi:class I SAM-dependent methyltransferase [Amycolatopsis regifaucium]|uniref:SAM-dependent methyltransferase n=1 Tax=Amycolatopsis regifaucium TaxID=546365 RepID=A0A154M586_9PSEU|nr:class I SAM-dependent methyltransferase [Amycolatopsis regifaucium]KZB79726.1 SAM-dependent methyltransferase [Amycolatopsis regifaucium]OKA09958.1 SAM-dependent methyltransferase [Amycolatopsis regifaucium]SFI67395.1 Methyltransferase domain-containing protein [Amycolatopsis regifaucium]